MKDLTKEFYENKAEKYILKTNKYINYRQNSIFIDLIKNKNEKILDLGCGSCSNALYFKDKKYSIIALDYSQKIIDIIRKNYDLELICLDFRKIENLNNLIKLKKVINIYASASLVHLKKEEFINLIEKIEFSGIFYFSLKKGIDEEIDKYKRFFSYFTYDEVLIIIKKKFDLLYFEESQDNMGRKSCIWLNFYCKVKELDKIV